MSHEKKHETHSEHSVKHDAAVLIEDAKELIAATAHATDEKITDARKRLESALASGREFFSNVQSRAVEGAKATDKRIRENPYQAMAVAFGVGALVGFLLTRRNRD